MLHRKEKLIITAIEIIDELGIQGLSTREIARRQGVSEATLFRHFKNKNDLLRVVLDHYSKFDADIFQSTKLKKLNPREAIIYFFNSYMMYYENYPAITSIGQLFDVFRYDGALVDKVESILNDHNYYIKQLIEDAQKIGIIDPNADIEGLVFILSGFCREICLKWRLEGQRFSLRERTLSTLEMFAHYIEDLFYFIREKKPKDIDCSNLSDLILEGSEQKIARSLLIPTEMR